MSTGPIVFVGIRREFEVFCRDRFRHSGYIAENRHEAFHAYFPQRLHGLRGPLGELVYGHTLPPGRLVDEITRSYAFIQHVAELVGDLDAPAP